MEKSHIFHGLKRLEVALANTCIFFTYNETLRCDHKNPMENLSCEKLDKVQLLSLDNNNTVNTSPEYLLR